MHPEWFREGVRVLLQRQEVKEVGQREALQKESPHFEAMEEQQPWPCQAALLILLCQPVRRMT